MTDEPPRDEDLAEGQTDGEPGEDQPWADRPEQTGGEGLRNESPADPDQ
jgi:hypothetical protein